VEEIAILLAPSAREKGLSLNFVVAENIPSLCEGDPARIRQILLNLSGNAIKFTERGSILLGLRYEMDPLFEDKSVLEFSVRDTGMGIAESRVLKIFEPFEQADSSTSRRFGGTGLGLTISRRLATLMSGTLTAQSRLGFGSEFFLRLPLCLAEKNASTPDEGPIPTIINASFALTYPLRILVAEDDRVNLKLILTMIRKFGYQPSAALDGQEALAIFQREPIDCILMDLQMPGMDGIDATRQIRALENSSNMPPTFISALTANTVPKDQRRCFDAGMNDYINKPIRQEQLARLLVRANAYKMRSIKGG
jgi:CheY-like chemotaxis protein